MKSARMISACLAAAAVLASTGGGTTATGGSGFERFDATTQQRFRSNSGLRQPRYEAIRDEARWGEIWNQLWSRHPQAETPRVDFKRHMLLVAAMGERPTGGFGIQIDSVRNVGRELVVTVTRTSSGRRCGTTAAITEPADIVKVPASKKKIRWEIRNRVLNCP